ncbi:type I CRISPR-associated protein Cas7 [Anaerorudis cellulosivorans]|uniref:type I CRISPR-associated protein Cas7 n=1 Tax=Anaerorudis cellulosivorans TaxID=3397862 RepID=UPI0022210AD8|nr:type I CRISPR-associated protein Cas7 [Seramator thermalis]MCW1735999.1 type I CRISPR-associated protein Cas7 [Seramator thermalis]
MTNQLKKSEILFLYETKYNIPNGDPFTGEQRYDEETKKILVSDVRMKRYVRTYFEEKELPIYVSEKTGAGKTDSKGVLTWIAQNRNEKKFTNIGDILKDQIDVRLFGGISTLKDDETKKIKIDGKECTNGHVQFTGPVQFALLNPSLNEVNLRIHQNTTHFTSSAENTQGSIGTTTIVPYSLIQIHGWLNPKVAEKTGMTEEDLKLMYEGLWYGTSGEGSSHSRSKVGQNSVLLLEIDYPQNNQKIYEVDQLIKLIPKEDKKEEQLRSMDDYLLDFSKLFEIGKTDKIEKIRFYTEIESIKDLFTNKKTLKSVMPQIKDEDLEKLFKKFEQIEFLKDKKTN